MFAIEFRTTIKDGKIEIPIEYKNRITDNVKVIILLDEKKKATNFIDKLLNFPLKIDAFKPFSRNEIYE